MGQRLLVIAILPGSERDPLVLPNDPPNEKMQPPERNYHHSILVSSNMTLHCSVPETQF